MIVSLGSEVVPGVRIILSGTDLPAGSVWHVDAVYADGLSGEVVYRPRGGSGVGGGSQLVLMDYAAPIRQEVAYRLYRDGVLVTTQTIVRPSTHDSVMTSLDAGLVVRFDQMADGGDQRYSVRRGAWTDVPGNPLPPGRLAPIAGAGGGSLTARTAGGETTRMRHLMSTNGLCYLLHSCDLLDCDIPPAALVWVASDANDRVAAGRAERDWSLSYRHAPDPEPDLIVAATTWDELDARWAAYTWADFDTAMAGRTWDEFDLIEWDQFA